MTSLATPSLAVLRVRFPRLAVAGAVLVPVVATAAGSTAGVILRLDAVTAVLVLAVAAGAAIAGLLMHRSRIPAAEYGLRRPANLRRAAWCLPMAVLPPAVLLAGGFRVAVPTALAYLVLTLAVALNEELWFRGIVMALLRPRSRRTAIAGSTLLFGVLHLASLLGGAAGGYVGLQIAFALVFGLVTALVVETTGSLVPVIAWHWAHDWCTYVGGDAMGPASLAALRAGTLALLGYAVLLWRRRPELSATPAPLVPAAA